MTDWIKTYDPVLEDGPNGTRVRILFTPEEMQEAQAHIDAHGEAYVWTLHHGEEEGEPDVLAPGVCRVNRLGTVLTRRPAALDGPEVPADEAGVLDVVTAWQG